MSFDKVLGALTGVSAFVPYLPVALAFMKAGHALLKAANPTATDDELISHAMTFFAAGIADDDRIIAELQAKIAAKNGVPAPAAEAK